MGYDIGWGNPFPAALPSGTPVHIVLADSPGNPGVLQRFYYEDPYTANKDVNLKNAENYTLSSGSTVLPQHGAQYWDTTSQRGYMYPVVKAETTPASGIPGGDVAYPYDTTTQAL